MELVAEASNGREALEQFRAHRPDVTLMDLQMPEMGGGIDAISAIRGEFPDARIIVLTPYSRDAQALRALEAGTRGYLLKNALHKDLVDTIRAVHAGPKALCPTCRSSWPSTPWRTRSRRRRSACYGSSTRATPASRLPGRSLSARKRSRVRHGTSCRSRARRIARMPR